MNSGKTIFSQLLDFLSSYEFRQCVKRYRGHYKIKSFSCWDQFLCMAFAQLSYRESLRDIQACLRGNQQELYHMGFRGKVSRNTLAHANQVRDWKIYADFAQILITQARCLYPKESFGVELKQMLVLRLSSPKGVWFFQNDLRKRSCNSAIILWLRKGVFSMEKDKEKSGEYSQYPPPGTKLGKPQHSKRVYCYSSWRFASRRFLRRFLRRGKIFPGLGLPPVPGARAGSEVMGLWRPFSTVFPELFCCGGIDVRIVD